MLVLQGELDGFVLQRLVNDLIAHFYFIYFHCQDDFQKSVAANPIQVGSRKKLSQWLCDRHNEVNEKLNKPKFDCSKVFERWLEGPPNGKCD
jgi:FAD-linked sulfhydryl oxidase